jgi:hypothetical protein
LAEDNINLLSEAHIAYLFEWFKPGTETSSVGLGRGLKPVQFVTNVS